MSSVANRPDPSTALKHLSHSPRGQQCGSVGGWQASSSRARPRKPVSRGRGGTCSPGLQQRVTCAGLSSDIRETSSPFSCLPARRSAFASFFTNSPTGPSQPGPPEWPLHEADQVTRPLTPPTPAARPPSRGAGSMGEVSLSAKDPIQRRRRGVRGGGQSGGNFHRRNADVMKSRPRGWGSGMAPAPTPVGLVCVLKTETLTRSRARSVLHTECLSK